MMSTSLSPFGTIGIAALALGGMAATPAGSPPPFLHAPSVTSYARHDPAGLTILPEGRYLKPVGQSIPLAKWPHGLAISPDGSTLFVASAGVGQLITQWENGPPVVVPVTLGEGQTNGGGAAFSPDGKTLYWSSGDSGSVYCVDVATHAITATIPLNVAVGGETFADSDAMDVKVSTDGASLYCADVTNFRVAVIDTRQQRVVGSVRVGRYPYALAVAGPRVYVANIGMFEYSPIPLPADKKEDLRGLTFPAYGFPSRQARDGVTDEGRRIPGLGDPNVPESFSVWGVDVSDPAQPKVIQRIKTGLLVGAPADDGKTIGGSAPNFLAVHSDALYVSNGNNDTIERIDLRAAGEGRGTRNEERGTRNEERAKARSKADGSSPLLSPRSSFLVPRPSFLLSPSPLVAGLRGVGPSGMAVSPDGARIYVAESGINALGVVDTRTGKLLGEIPTAWYPYRVAISPDGQRLACICFRGFGNGPKGAAHEPDDPYLGMKGSLTVLDVPAGAALARMTADVLAYNGIVDRSADRRAMASPVIPADPGQRSAQIQYVVFLTKENHTYDTIFDHVPGANDDPHLLRWGYHQQISAPGQPTLEDAAVMTNHNALARQFTVSDNFYVQPEASGVGHRWLVGVQPNNFCQMTYTLGWDFKARSSAPGRRASFGSNGSIAPEDYPEAGSMWEHLARFGVPFRNYGEGFEFAGVLEDQNEARTGAREVVNIPMSKVLYDHTCREFPIFNMNIPDQYRADWFAEDFTKQFLSGGKKMPPFINIAICNDHGTDPNPKRGYPYRASWMADNDLAFGRIIEFLSHTPYWKHMAIFVTQDDAGGENDHVDAQRSVLLVISPWARHGYVSHRHTTITSMHRTLYAILGLPPLNMFDALANDLSDCFTATPDFRPYQHVGVDPRIFDPERAKDPGDPSFRKAMRAPSVALDDPVVEARMLQDAGSRPARR